MMRKIATALALMGLCVAEQASAANWVFVGTDNTGMSLYYDSSSIDKSKSEEVQIVKATEPLGLKVSKEMPTRLKEEKNN